MNKKDKAYIESLAGKGQYNLPDYDGDGVPDILDCDPLDPNKDGPFGDVYKSVFSRARSISSIARRRLYRPVATSGREALSTVYKRAYGAGAAMRGRIETPIKRAREFVRAPPAERSRRITAGKEAFIAARKPKAISDVSRRIHEETAKVARVARGFEKQIDPRVRDVERALGYHSEIVPKSVRWAGEQTKQLGYGIAFHAPAAAVEMAGMIPGAAETIYHKPEILPAAATLGVHMMGESMVTGITKHPGRTVGEFVGLGAITKGAKLPASIKQRAKLPSGIAAKIPKVELPKLDVPKHLFTEKAVKPEGFAELSPAKQIKYEAGVKVLKALYHTKGTQSKPLDFTEVKALPGKSGLIVEKWIKAHPEQKPVMAGSAVPRTQIKGTRMPGDVDIHVVDRALAAKQLYADLKPTLGENVRIDKAGTGIETRAPSGKWSHAVDLQPAFEGLELILPELPWSIRPDPITIGGIKYATIGEQLMRKASTTLQVRTPKMKQAEPLSWEVLGGKKVFRKDIELGPGMKEHVVKPGDPTLGPKPHRAHKDVKDFMDISDEVLSGRLASAESAWFLKQYRVKKEMATAAEMEAYKMHASLYPDPYPAYRAYKALPPSTKLPAYLIASATAADRGYPKSPTPPYAPGYQKAQTLSYTPGYPWAAKHPAPSSLPYTPGITTTAPPYAPGYPKTPKTPPPPYTPKYPPTQPPPDTPRAPPTPPPDEPPWPPYTPPPYEKKPPTVRRPDKKRRKIKGKKAKPDIAIGWKQKHELITLADFLGYKP